MGRSGHEVFSYCAFSALSLLAHGMGEEVCFSSARHDGLEALKIGGKRR